MIILHGGFMTVALLLMAAGAVTARFMKKKRWWLKAHRFLETAGYASLLAGLLAAVVMVSLFSGTHLALPHAWLGLIIVIGATGTFTMGLLQFRMPERARSIRPLHRWSGRITIALLTINILSGLTLIGII